MQKDILSNVEKFNRVGLDSARRLGEINLKLFERLTENQLAFAAEYFETGYEQLKRLGESKDLQTVVQGQSRFVSELQQKVADHARRTAEVFADARGDYADLIESGLKAADIAPTAAKAAAGKKAA